MPPTTQKISALTLALALGTALNATTAAAETADKEKCYGVALKAKNDCAAGAGTTCAGTSRIDHQGDAWSFVPKGSCEKDRVPDLPHGLRQLAAFKEKQG